MEKYLKMFETKNVVLFLLMLSVLLITFKKQSKKRERFDYYKMDYFPKYFFNNIRSHRECKDDSVIAKISYNTGFKVYSLFLIIFVISISILFKSHVNNKFLYYFFSILITLLVSIYSAYILTKEIIIYNFGIQVNNIFKKNDYKYKDIKMINPIFELDSDINLMSLKVGKKNTYLVNYNIVLKNDEIIDLELMDFGTSSLGEFLEGINKVNNITIFEERKSNYDN